MRTAAQRSFVGAGAFALFIAVLVAGVATRAWRIGDLVAADAPASTFFWLPLLVGRDLLLASFFALAPGLLMRIALPRVLVMTSASVVAVAVIVWRVANALSYHTVQGAITMQRLRGGDGARVKDMNLLAWQDVLPVVALLAVLLFVVLPWAVVVARNVHASIRLRWLVAAIGLGVMLDVGAQTLWRHKTFGLDEEPVWVFLRSCMPVRVGQKVALPDVDFGDLERARTPLLGTDPDGIGRAPGAVKNVIVFFAEGIAREYTSLGSAPPTETPHLLERTLSSGLEFSRYYSPYHKSISAIFSFFCSDYPPPTGKNITELNPRIDCGELSELVHPHGIQAGLFHAGQFNFYNKLALLGGRRYSVQKDALSLNPKKEWMENEWGVDDRAMVDGALAWIDSLEPDDRFVAAMISLAPHYPYELPPDVAALEPENSERDRYLSALHFLDEAFERLMQGLEARGMLDDTAVIFLADHGENIWEPLRPSPGKRVVYDNNLHVPFVIFAPRIIPHPAESRRPGGHVDLVPTVLDLLGLPPASQNRGRSLIAPDWQEKRLFFGANNGPDSYVGFMDGNDKIIVNHTTGRIERYNLSADPEEMRDLAGVNPLDDRNLADEALAFYDLQMARLESAPAVGDDVALEEEVAANATVRLVHGVRKTVCAPVDDDERHGRTCRGETDRLFVGHRPLRVGQTMRDCLAVRVPPEGDELEIEVTDADTLPLMTRVQFGLGPVSLKPVDGVSVSVLVDDDDARTRVLDRAQLSRTITFPMPYKRARIRVSGAPFDGMVCLAFSGTPWTR